MDYGNTWRYTTNYVGNLGGNIVVSNNGFVVNYVHADNGSLLFSLIPSDNSEYILRDSSQKIGSEVLAISPNGSNFCFIDNSSKFNLLQID